MKSVSPPVATPGKFKGQLTTSPKPWQATSTARAWPRSLKQPIKNSSIGIVPPPSSSTILKNVHASQISSDAMVHHAIMGPFHGMHGLFWERFLDFPSCQDQSKRLRAKMQNDLNQFHNADFCLHCYVQIKICDTDSSASLFINHCNHKSWLINLSFMLSTSFHVVKPSGQSQRFEIIAHFWGVDLLFEHWKCNKIRLFRPRPCSAKFWKQGLDLGEVRFLSHFVSTKNHTKTPVAQFLQIMLLGNIMGSHLIWLLAPLFETFAVGTKTLHLLFQIKRAAMSLFSRMDCTIAAWSFCALSMADWQNTPVTTWV